MLERVLSALLGVPFLLGAAAGPAHSGAVVFRFQDPEIIEASALVATGDVMATSNDSGDTGRVFAVDPTSGQTVGVTSWEADPTDVEALAPGPEVDGSATVWVGDIGDNRASRDTVEVAQVPVGRGDRTVHPTVYDLAYPDGPHDAETLVRDPADGRLYVASKGVLGGTLYAAPAHLVAGRVNRMTAVGPVLPIATDGAFFPDGTHLILRNYGAATVYDWPSLAPIGTITLPAQQQGEGIAVEPDGQIFLDSEGLHSPVLRLVLPPRLAGAVRSVPATPTSDAAHPASPSAPVSAASSPSPSSSSAASASSSSSRSVESSGADHTASWLLGVGILVLGVLLAAVGWRRSRVE